MSRAGQLHGRLGAVIRTADRIGYWVRWRVHATDRVPLNVWPAQDSRHRSTMSGVSRSQVFSARDQTAWLSIGNCLRAQYDTLARPVPPHIAALVEQLEMVNRATMHAQKPHWLDYDPLALAVLVIGIGLIELLVLLI
jgi:hypothetical protein